MYLQWEFSSLVVVMIFSNLPSPMFPLPDGDGGIKSFPCSFSSVGAGRRDIFLTLIVWKLSWVCKPFLIWQIRQSKQKLNFSDHLIYFHIILLFIEKQNIIRKLFTVKCIHLFIHFIHSRVFHSKIKSNDIDNWKN